MDFGRVECIYAKGNVGSGGEGSLLEPANVYMRIRVGMRVVVRLLCSRFLSGVTKAHGELTFQAFLS